jgi:hypothetical protein
MGIPNEFYSGREAGLVEQNQHLQPNTLYSNPYRYSLDGHMDAMDISEGIEANRKRASDSLFDTRKRASINSISSPMRPPRNEMDEQFEHLDRSQLMQMIFQLQQDVSDLQQTCRRYEDHLGARDQRVKLLQQEVEEKNAQLNKAAQFKEFLLRYMEYLPDNLK